MKRVPLGAPTLGHWGRGASVFSPLTIGKAGQGQTPPTPNPSVWRCQGHSKLGSQCPRPSWDAHTAISGNPILPGTFQACEGQGNPRTKTLAPQPMAPPVLPQPTKVLGAQHPRPWGPSCAPAPGPSPPGVGSELFLGGGRDRTGPPGARSVRRSGVHSDLRLSSRAVPASTRVPQPGSVTSGADEHGRTAVSAARSLPWGLV